jgi:DNA-binding NtrC family response regulator
LLEKSINCLLITGILISARWVEGDEDVTSRILFIEDDEDVRSLIEDLLLDEGYEVEGFERIAPALAKLASHRYDLVLTDGLLPDGTGLVVAARATQRAIPVLIFSGFTDQLPQNELAKYTVLKKPGDLGRLVETVAQNLAAK